MVWNPCSCCSCWSMASRCSSSCFGCSSLSFSCSFSSSSWMFFSCAESVSLWEVSSSTFFSSVGSWACRRSSSCCSVADFSRCFPMVSSLRMRVCDCSYMLLCAASCAICSCSAESVFFLSSMVKMKWLSSFCAVSKAFFPFWVWSVFRKESSCSSVCCSVIRCLPSLLLFQSQIRDASS